MDRAAQAAYRAPFVKVDHAARDTDQIVGRRLEELIARIGLQHVQHSFGVVALRIKAEVADDALDLLAQHWNFSRAQMIGSRSPQAQKAMFARDLAPCTEALHPDIVEVGRPMHAGDGIGFGENQQLAVARSRTQLPPQYDCFGGALRLALRRIPRLVRRARVRAVRVCAALETVVAIADKQEMASPASNPAAGVLR